ncbi:hypothetical protein [Pseudokineococcus lusitanus]|uniref:Secreted protein n=1 Tax=Pseudokineococcus lusitanus TaxID=763993 RepID=A0A3N1HQS4_9ACTN|nr:hypothetical protein [Pseudokineococcus lusitanus]ROP44864.1 hypothetical protein EDC03_0994 [Pseudokineococcus lusitanus]
MAPTPSRTVRALALAAVLLAPVASCGASEARAACDRARAEVDAAVAAGEAVAARASEVAAVASRDGVGLDADGRRAHERLLLESALQELPPTAEVAADRDDCWSDEESDEAAQRLVSLAASAARSLPDEPG